MTPLRTARAVVVSAFVSILLGAAAKPGLAQTANQTDTPAAASIKVPSRILAPVDDAVRVPLTGTVHPRTRTATDQGTLPDSTPLSRVQVFFKRSDAQETALHQLIDDLHNPASASFHKWLTPDQFGQQFGPSDADIAAISSWLAAKGLTVTKVNPGRQTLEFQGTSGQLNSAFHTDIHRYAAAGRTHFANSKEPEIPAALAPVFGGFVSLNNFPVKSHLKSSGTAAYDRATNTAKPNWTIGSSTTGYYFVIAPMDYAVQYDLNPLYTAGTNGAGQTIAIINEANIDVYLANQFRSTFNLPANPPQIVIDGQDPGIDGVNNPDGMNYASGEAYLDVEWAGAVAPQATVDLVIAADTQLSSGLFLAAQHAVYSNLAPVMSLSFGECEADLGSTNQFIGGLWQQAAAQGITVVVSAGDGGSAGCDDFDSQAYAVGGQAVNGFGSTPYNVIVGGTDFYYSAYNQGSAALNTQLASYWSLTPSNTAAAVSIKGVIPEQPWNNSQYGLDASSYYATYGTTNIVAGSGGASTCSTSTYATTPPYAQVCTPYAKPSWQTGTGVPADKVRDVPDVSLFAANGQNYTFIPMCATNGDCQPVTSGTIQVTGTGGTSAAAPSFAGIMALVNQKYGRQGQADYTLYPLAQQYPASFHDVTVGTNTVPCSYSNLTYPTSITPVNCIAVPNPITATDDNYGKAVEGEIGSGTTAEYNAGVGYDLATGLGTLDANVLVGNWNKVTFNGTTTTLTPSGTSFAHGSAVSFTGTVKNTTSTVPTGSVALLATSTLPNMQGQDVFTLASGSFTGSVTTLPGGTYSVYGRYGGDGSNAASTSTPASLTITPESSATSLLPIEDSQSAYQLLSSGTTVPYGTSVTIEALPSPTAQAAAFTSCITKGTTCPVFTFPTGSVAFSDGATALQTVPVNANGEAAYSIVPAIGSHSVSAVYSGDASYGASTSAATTFTVAKNTPSVYGFSDTLATVGGASTVLTFLIESSAAISSLAAAPTGSLTLSGGPAGTPTTVALIAGIDPGYGAPEGIGTVVLPATTTAGTYTITFVYPGDANYNAVTSRFTFTIAATSSTLLPSATSATPSATSLAPAAGITLGVTVAGQTGHPAPTGSLAILANGYYLYQGTLPASTGSSVSLALLLDSYALLPGINSVIVEYLGDTVYQPSTTTLTLTNSLADFTLTPNTTSLTTSGATATETVSVGSSSGFAGAVSLSCSSTAAITCTFSPASVTLTANGTTTASLGLDTSKVAVGTYSILLTGKDATGQFVHTVALTVNVAAASTFSLTSAGAITIATQGASGTSALTLTSVGGFAGAVNLTCALTSSPGGATNLPTCTVTTPVTLAAAGTAPSTLTVNTTAQVHAAIFQPSPIAYAGIAAAPGTHAVRATLLGTALAVLLLSVPFWLGEPLRRRSLRRLAAGLSLLILAACTLGSLSGCSSSGSSSTGSGTGTLTGGTTLGTYTFTVTATDASTGKITATTAVSVTVN